MILYYIYILYIKEVKVADFIPEEFYHTIQCIEGDVCIQYDIYDCVYHTNKCIEGIMYVYSMMYDIYDCVKYHNKQYVKYYIII